MFKKFLMFNSSPKISTWTILISLLLVDIALILANVTALGLKFGGLISDYNPMWTISSETNFAGLFTFGKWISLVVVLTLVWRRTGAVLYLSLAAVFLVLFADDTLEIHENLGLLFWKSFDLQPGLGLRAQDFGELLAWLTIGTGVLLILGPAYLKADRRPRQRLHIFVLGFAALAFFGIFLDMVHIVVAKLPGLTAQFAEVALALAEDGGEIIVASLMLAYGYYVLVDVSRDLAPPAGGTAPRISSDRAPPLTSAVDAIYVINLASRGDRRREMRDQLDRLGLSFHHPKVILFKAECPDTAHPFDSIGAKGCFQSHLALLKNAKARGLSSILILEDDGDFADHISNANAPDLAALQTNDWDMVHLGYDPAFAPADWRYSKMPLVDLAPDHVLQQSHMILLSDAAIRQAVNYFELMLSRPPGHPEGGPMDVDGAYNWFRAAHPDLKTFASPTPWSLQRPSRSDIRSKNWKDHVPMAQTLRHLKAQAKHH